MMSLDLVKLHLRIDDDDEDDLLRLYLEAATDHCAHYLNCPLYADESAAEQAAKDGKPLGVVMNPVIRNAVLLTVGYLYTEREDGAAGLPRGARRLLEAYRKLPGV